MGKKAKNAPARSNKDGRVSVNMTHSELPDADLDRLVADIRLIQRMGALNVALHIGKLIVERIFHGDCATWRERRNKDTSFRKLATRPDLPMSAPVLYRAVCTYDLATRLGGLEKWVHLTASHVRAVLCLDEANQVKLLRCAEEDRWSVDRLESEVRKRTEGRGARRGRRPQPALVKAIGQMTRLVEDAAPVFDAPQLFDSLDDDELAVLVLRVEGIREHLDTLHRALGERRGRKVSITVLHTRGKSRPPGSECSVVGPT